MFVGVLPTFEVFLKKKKNLQHEKPMVHLLHIEMERAAAHIYEPEAIPLSIKDILKISVLTSM